MSGSNPRFEETRQREAEHKLRLRSHGGRPLHALLLAVQLTVILILSWGAGSRGAEASGPPNPNLSIDVSGVAGCTTNTAPPPGMKGDTKCNIAPGSQFTVRAFVNSIGGLPDLDTDTKAGYKGVQIRLIVTAGLTLKNRPGQQEITGIWPNCGIPTENKLGLPAAYAVACNIAVGANESLFTGQVAAVDYNCATLGQQTVTLDHGAPTGSHITNEANAAVLDKDPDEVLTINCLGVGGIAKLPDIAGRPLEAQDSGRSRAALAGMAVMMAAVAVALGGATWYVLNRGQRRLS